MTPKPSFQKLSFHFAIRCLLACSVSLNLVLAAAPAADEPLAISNYQALSQARTRWLMTNLLDAYRRTGHKSPEWDKPLTNALASFALVRGSEGAEIDLNYLVRRLTLKAIEAGADDPMMDYLTAREDDMRARSRAFDVKPGMRSVADRLFASSYPTLFKLNAASRAGARVKVLTGTGSEFPPEILPYRQKALHYFHEVLEDRTIPPLEIYDAFHLLFDGMHGDEAAMEAAWKELEPAIAKFSTNAGIYHMIKGRYHNESAWIASGLGYAGILPEKGWKESSPRLKLAIAELETAWKLDPQWPEIAIDMITSLMGLGGGQEELELWFGRAMAADPNSYRACLTKLTFLEPERGGSEEKMLAFGRQCASSTNWGGEVPLILEKAHDTISKYWTMEGRTDYWKHTEIWNEIKVAYDKFYASRARVQSTLPDVGTRSRLLRVAYRTGHYDEMIDLMRGMKDVDYDLFGGQDQFRKLFRYANSKAAQPLTTDDFKTAPRTAPAK